MLLCNWCKIEIKHGRYCSKQHRQTAWRARKNVRLETGPSAGPLKFCYADPPYIGLAKRYYGKEPTFAGEVDHVALLAQLTGGDFDGWALSCSAKSLRFLLPLCPATVIVCPWIKPGGTQKTVRGKNNRWEPVLVMPGRRLKSGVRDWIQAHPARGNGTLMGRKPLAFALWLFEILGMQPGDSLIDLFPGTGMVGSAWAAVSSLQPGDDVSARVASDVSLSADSGGDGAR